MSGCRCVSPPRLHITPDGLHRPDGAPVALVLVDEAWGEPAPRCSVCETALVMACFRCQTCDSLICRACVQAETELVECECALEVTGVEMAARRAARSLRG